MKLQFDGLRGCLVNLSASDTYAQEKKGNKTLKVQIDGLKGCVVNLSASDLRSICKK